jgi:hypothetical protein
VLRSCHTVAMSSGDLQRGVDLFDDPPWTDSPDVSDRDLRPRWMVAALGLCIFGAIDVAISTALPWFGFDDNTAHGFLGLTDEASAVSQYLVSSPGHSLSPGTQGWGFLILTLSSLLTVVGSATFAAYLIGRSPPVGLYVFLLALGAVLFIACILDAHARPPFGDGPPLRFSWGAVVGVISATAALVGTCLALIIGRR